MAEQKGPGFKDIGDLRAKLGLSTPAKPAPAPGEDAPTMPAQTAPMVDDDEPDEATAIVSVVDDAALAAMDAAQAASGPDAAVLAAAHVRTPTPGLGDAATAPAAASPMADAIPPPSSDAPADQQPAPLASPLLAPPAAPAAPAAPEAAPGMGSPFGQPGPLPQPPSGPLMAPPAGAIGLDMGDATVAAFAPIRRQQRKFVLIATVVVGVCALSFGYIAGDLNKQRILINKQIGDANRVVKPLKASIVEVKAVLTQLKRADLNKVNWKLAEKLVKFNAKFKIEELGSDNLLLGPSITGDLIEYTYLANRLEDAARNHAKMTLKKHKAFLEDFEKGNAAMKSDKPMFVFHGGGKGILVTPVGEPFKEGRTKVIKIRTLSGAERTAELKSLIAIDKRDLIGASGPNVMELYSLRIKDMKVAGAALDKLMDGLALRVQTLANKSTVFSL